MAEHETAIDFAAALPETDYADRKKMYRSFLSVAKYAVAGIALILILMAIFLT
jgi:hypothetical protein